MQFEIHFVNMVYWVAILEFKYRIYVMMLTGHYIETMTTQLADNPSESRAGCECPAPEEPPRPDTDEKATLRAEHPEAAARRRRHCQSTEFHVLRRQMVNIWRYLLRHFCRCHR